MKFSLLVFLALLMSIVAPTAVASPHTIPMFMPDGDVRQGFARIINHSNRGGTVRIHGTDDTGRSRGPITLSIGAEATQHFNSSDLERGNASKGLPRGLGDGSGRWRLRLESDLDIEVAAYIRTGAGFLASVHDVVTTVNVGGETVHRVPIFNPGSNRQQVSWLRVANLTGRRVNVTIEGRDDAGLAAPGGEVRLSLSANRARHISAQQIESGAAGLTGRFGDGTGKWQLFVTADGEVEVLSLMSTTSGHLTNLSMSLREESVARTAVDTAGPAWAARHNLSGSQYQAASTTYARQGYRLVQVSGYTVGGEARYAAIWSKAAGPAWAARHNLSGSQYQAASTTYARQGYRLVQVSGYTVGGEARYAAIWSKAAGPAWAARHNLSESQYLAASTTYAREGYRLVQVSGYTVGGEARYAAIWSKAAGPAWAARHNLSGSQYQAASTTYAREGYRLVDVSGYTVGGEARYAAIWSKAAGPAWAARHNLSGSQYQAASTTYAREDYRLVDVSGYTVGGEARYAAIWSKVGDSVRTAQHMLPLFLPAGQARKGFARIINRSDRSGTVRVYGTDDTGRRRGPISLSLDAGATRHFNSDDLERGNTSKGLTGALGNGTGNWRLEVATDLDIEPSAYIRTADGFLTAMHAVARASEVGGETVHRVPIFNPGSNSQQVSWLRVANLTDSRVNVTIRARDDAGDPAPLGEVRLTLPANGARRYSAQELESGAPVSLRGRLGDGSGKWRLSVTADGDIEVVSLLQSPTGHLSNLSTTPLGGFEVGGFEVVADGPSSVRPLQTISLSVPGGLGESDYTVLMDLSGTGAFGDNDTIEVEGLTTDKDEILTASPMRQALAERNTGGRLALRVRREADGALSNVLRLSIEDIRIPTDLSGFPAIMLETILKAIYSGVGDPLLEAEAASIQPGLATKSARTLGLDLSVADVQAEAVLQALLGIQVTALVADPSSVPASSVATPTVSRAALRDVHTSASRDAGKIFLACRAALTLIGSEPKVCSAIANISTCYDEVTTGGRTEGDLDALDNCSAGVFDHMSSRDWKNVVPVPSPAGVLRAKTVSNVTQHLLRKLPARSHKAAATALSHANSVNAQVGRYHKLTRVLDDPQDARPGDRHYTYDATGRRVPTKRGTRIPFDTLVALIKATTRDAPEQTSDVQRDYRDRSLGDEEKAAVWGIVEESDRHRREAETIEDHEGVYTGEQDPRDAIGNDPDDGRAVGSSCKTGYREFVIEEDKVSTCVFESLVEPRCYPGSIRRQVPNLGDSNVCLYYPRDFYQPNGMCRQNYADVLFQGQRTCRWAELGPNQAAWYTLYKVDDEDPMQPTGYGRWAHCLQWSMDSRTTTDWHCASVVYTVSVTRICDIPSGKTLIYEGTYQLFDHLPFSPVPRSCEELITRPFVSELGGLEHLNHGQEFGVLGGSLPTPPTIDAYCVDDRDTCVGILGEP